MERKAPRVRQRLTRPRSWLSALPCCLLLWVGSALSGAETQREIVLLKSADTPLYARVDNSLRGQLRGDAIHIHSRTTDTLAQAPIKADLVVSIGSEATRIALQQSPPPPLLAILIPAQAFDRLTNDSDHPAAIRVGTLSALYLEQPLERQLQLAQLIKPEARNLGTAVGPLSAANLHALQSASARFNLDLHAVAITPDDNPVKRLTPVIERSDIFLAQPDRKLFNRGLARWLLYITARARIPLIGFSPALVNAGAIAGVYSSPDSVAKESAEWIRRWYASPDGTLPPPAYPRLFELSTNPSAARSLRLNIADPETLKQQLINSAQP